MADVVREQWAPGNATNYDLVLVRDAHWRLVCWLDRGAVGRAFRWDVNMPVPVGYFVDKLDVTESDGFAIALWLHSQGETFRVTGALLNQQSSRYPTMFNRHRDLIESWREAMRPCATKRPV